MTPATLNYEFSTGMCCTKNGAKEERLSGMSFGEQKQNKNQENK